MAGTSSAAWVDVLPSMGKFATNLTRGVTSAARSAGTAAGRQFSSAVNAGAAQGAGTRGLVQELEESAKKAARAVQDERTNIARARAAERAATENVAAAEARLSAQRTKIQAANMKVTQSETALAAAREKHGATSAQAMRAEAQLVTAQAQSQAAASAALRAESGLTTVRDRAEAAAGRTANTVNALRAAQTENTTVTAQLAEAQQQAGSRAGRFRQSLLDANNESERGTGVMQRLTGGAKNVAGAIASTLKPLAGLAAGFALVVGAGNVISLGNEYTATMNELQSVAGLTDAQMVKVGKTARALGSDIALPATSGKDAAAVMLELSKGGFTAAGAMEAARGTIVLAAAAQVDGARAAEIQSNAINQFGLQAKDASMVADVLANTANAAAGGVDDIATSMKYVGPVARTLGIGIGDTAAAVGLLANNGLKGDTAGTALRGMLASLSAPSKQAAGALDALGIKAFNSSGEFVGMRSVIEQLSAAQGRMTKEQFAANAALAFGREPLAAVSALASSGAGAYDTMTAAVTKQGGAADVANSKMKGLGGAMDKLQSQLEDIALGIYQTVTPYLEGAVNGIAGFLDGAGDKISTFLDTAGGLANLAIGGTVSGDLTATTNLVPNSPEVLAILQARDVVISAFTDIRTFVMTALIPSLRNLAPVFGDVAVLVAGAFLGALRMAAGVLRAIGPPLVAVTGWIKDNRTWLIAAAIALGTFTAAMKVSNAVIQAGGLIKYVQGIKVVSTATKIWAGVQWLLNSALVANPIFLVIAALVALGAGLVYAYTHSETFRNVVQAVFAWVTNAVKAVGQWFVWLYTDGIKPAVDWIVAAVKSVGQWFSWLYTAGIKPAIDWIAAAASWLWDSVLSPVFTAIGDVVRFVVGLYVAYFRMWISIFTAVGTGIAYVWSNYISPVFELIGAIVRTVVGAAFVWLRDSVIGPVFAWISNAVTWWWTTTKANFTAAVSFVRDVLGAVFTWLYENIIGPVFGWISAAAVQWWTTVSGIFLGAVSFVRDTLGAVFTWLYSNVISPVFSWISNAVSLWWSGTVLIFTTVVSFVRNTFATAFTWLRDSIIRPVWDGISSVISGVWNNGIKPIFDKVADFAKNTIPQAFETMKDGVGKAWDFIKTAAKAPIKFVVNTVVNDALIGNFNKVADIFGTKKMPTISLPEGFAGGGVIPGYSSVKKDDHLRPMRAGEGVLVPEVVRALGPGFVHTLNAAGNSGGVGAVRSLAGYAQGGIVGAVTSGWDWVKGAAGKAWDWGANAAETAAGVVADPIGTLGKLVKGVIGQIPGAGHMVDVAAGMGSKVLDSAIAALKKLGESDGPAGGKNGQLSPASLAKVSGFTGGPGVGELGGYLRRAAARAWEAMQSASGGALTLTEGYRDMANQQKRWAMYKAGGNLAAVPGSSVHGLGNAADIGAGQAWARANGPRFGWYPTGLSFSQREPWHFEYKGGGAAGGGMSFGGIVPKAKDALKGYGLGGIVAEPTLYDNGGYLPTGTTLVENRTGKPEPVFTSEQFDQLGDGSGDGKTVVYATIGGTGDHNEDMRDLRRALRDKKRGGK